MSNQAQKVHTIEARDIVKDNAELYRDSEIARMNNELLNNFVKYNQEEVKGIENILQVMVK